MSSKRFALFSVIKWPVLANIGAVFDHQQPDLNKIMEGFCSTLFLSFRDRFSFFFGLQKRRTSKLRYHLRSRFDGYDQEQQTTKMEKSLCL